ncbi:bet1-like SNARE 1-2 [Punica granatum]|uniref:Bet1-like SNARE 1-2 n=1 Tax=Punica granatum TaxID=22663 RepID=A0A218VT47_PUNGR|nr:bet1-like SNARE 1-2 [Punica granatum]XP_031376217.1 bet1-like SNARE 1-2 [Punica granatum]OWM63191.1 hypothetical protein CDL15_Pgr010591 [Punica granatum]
MSYKRDSRASRASLFDNYSNIEEGRGSSSSRSHEINEHDNDKAVDSLHDRVTFLKRLTGDIHNEVENHNHLLDKMGKSMDASRGTMSRTVDRFKKVFDKKSNRQVCKLAAYFVVLFISVYFLIKFVGYFMWR